MRKRISHPNVCAYEDSGSFSLNGQQFSYLVTQFVSSESLAARLQRQPDMDVTDARQLALTLLRLLRYLHTLPQPIAHGNISAKTILLDLAGQLTDLKLSGFGLQCKPADASDTQADLHAVGALLYRMCFGMEAQLPPRMPNVMPEGMDQHLLLKPTKRLIMLFSFFLELFFVETVVVWEYLCNFARQRLSYRHKSYKSRHPYSKNRDVKDIVI